VNIFESAYFLIGFIWFVCTWWFMLEYFPTPKHSLSVRLAWMATFGVFTAFIAGLLWPLTLLGFIVIAAVSNDA
jgi:hypothetical protein